MLRRSLLTMGALVILLLAVVVYVMTTPNDIKPPVVLPVTTSSVPPTTQSPTTSPAPTPSVTTSTRLVIDGSAPTELYIPRLKKTIDLSKAVCPLSTVNGEVMLDPDRNDFTKACYFVNKEYPYSLPGTDAPDIAVLAGHTSRLLPSASFNVFYDWRKAQFTVRKDDELWGKTAKSGKHWLVYKAADLLTPKKYAASGSVSLMNDPAVWGTAPTPGVLVTIGCLQPKEAGKHSSENIAIKWQFSRVEL
jgi:hypothetical protein